MSMYEWMLPMEAAPPQDADTLLALRTRERLRSDPVTKRARLRVSACAGVVVLRGKVPDRAVLAAASRIAVETPGARDVSNQVRFPRDAWPEVDGG
ncbi:BON domain-containing protein [Motilibacter peucedani]|uniref:BON domain-containing protein n=1 Tax=Motilibacter peucedani TaxID=598650 RepID=A0A420XQI9_9ACTN|nr:BON domain-containing protein [Motilibacter peucedani]RKS75571.1 BON domain-containing protein [Motilibacter peucedani]